MWEVDGLMAQGGRWYIVLGFCTNVNYGAFPAEPGRVNYSSMCAHSNKSSNVAHGGAVRYHDARFRAQI